MAQKRGGQRALRVALLQPRVTGSVEARREVLLGDGVVRVERRQGTGRSIVELVIHEGRNRIVRRLLDEVGHPVRRLTRTQLGPIRLGSLPSGRSRELTGDELGSLLDGVGL